MYVDIEKLEKQIEAKQYELYHLRKWLIELKYQREKECQHNYVLHLYNCDTDNKKCFKCTKCERIM